MIKATFSHIGLTCENPLKIEEFYIKYFGFKRTMVYNYAGIQIVMIKSDNIYLELFQATENSPLKLPKETGYNYQGWRHICFLVDDLDKKLEEFEDDIKITLGPLDMSELIEGMRICWIADPEGNIIELAEGYKDN